MKIAHIITRLDRGGSSDVVLTLFQRFLALGHDVTLIYGKTDDYPEGFPPILERNRQRIKYLPFLRREINVFRDPLSFYTLVSILRKGSFDLVHTHTSKAGFLGRLAARVAGVPMIVHAPHGHIFYGYHGRLTSGVFIFLEKMAARWCDRIITLTGMGKRDHIRFGIAAPDKFVPIYCGIDLERFEAPANGSAGIRRELGIADGDPVIGTVSRLVPIKGCENFIRAFKGIQSDIPNARAVIVGDGPLRAGLEGLTKELGLEREVIFTGARIDTPELLREFDVYVQSSLNEGLGRSIVEAMASGRCVVATRVGGVPEIVEDRVTGILVEPEDPEALRAAVVGLLRDDASRAAFGDRGRVRANELFGEDRMIERTERLYRELAEGKGAKR
ncbi:MAG: glycosyltransferase family 4 protein [Candidatus Omnitrophota bacterium]